MILVTGANGFIGKALINQLKSLGYNVRGAVRTQTLASNKSEFFQISSLDSNTDWSHALRSCNIVIHLAAMAHKYKGLKSDELANFMRINCEASINLAHQAHKAGVRRFIFLSSTGVMGPQVTSGFSYGPNTHPKPHNPYTISKACAEQELLKLSNEFTMAVTILRVPVVYGPNAPGSIGTLIKAIKFGVPLPLGGLVNRRHLIALENLVDLIISCISVSTSASEVFIASDDEALSTSDLCYLCGDFVGKRPRLISLSPRFFLLIATVLGMKKKVANLLGDLELDASRTKSYFKWSPKYSPSEHVRDAKNKLGS